MTTFAILCWIITAAFTFLTGLGLYYRRLSGDNFFTYASIFLAFMACLSFGAGLYVYVNPL